jgi:hypothetical protein
MAAPDLRLEIKNPFDVTPKGGQKKTWWAPVGDISLWRKEDGTYSGRLRLFLFSTEFHVFEARPEDQRPKPAQNGQAGRVAEGPFNSPFANGPR